MTMTNTTRTIEILLAEEALVHEFAVRCSESKAEAARIRRLVESPIESVVRKFRCPDCGHRHVDGVEVTLDEPTVVGMVTGFWCCDECGSDFWDRVRVVRKDHVK